MTKILTDNTGLATSDKFGWAVTMSADGDKIEVKAYGQDDGVSDTGITHTFTKVADGWTEVK